MNTLEHNKQLFLNKLTELLKQTGGFDNLYRLDYLPCNDVVEWLYITYDNGVQKYLNITGESCTDIMRIILTKADKARGIMPYTELCMTEYLPSDLKGGEDDERTERTNAETVT